MTSTERFAGMSVNERLFAAQLLAPFDQALRDADEAELKRIFASIGLPDYDLAQLRGGL